MIRLQRTLAGMVLFGSMHVLAQATPAYKTKPQPAGSHKAEAAQPADRGQQVFDHNCSRCHQAPEGFPQSISGTVAHHMKVRGNLSEKDYQALLEFLNAK